MKAHQVNTSEPRLVIPLNDDVTSSQDSTPKVLRSDLAKRLANKRMRDEETSDRDQKVSLDKPDRNSEGSESSS